MFTLQGLEIEREGNIFERYPRVKKAIPLLERKIQLEKEWNKKEASTFWFPAPKMTEGKNPYSLEVFSKLSVTILILLVAMIFPIPILVFPLYKTFRARRDKIDELKSIERELRSILPAKYCEERGDYIPAKYKYLLPYFFKNGIFFEKANREVLEETFFA